MDFRSFSRVVLQNGLELSQVGDGTWVTEANASKPIHIAPEEAVKKLGLHVVLLDTLNKPTSLTLTAPIRGGQALEIQHSTLGQEFAHSTGPRVLATLDLQYCLTAATHRLKKLAESYVSVCRDFTRFPRLVESLRGDTIIFGYQFEPYFGFEALVDDVDRIFRSTKNLMWAAFGPSHNRPNDFLDCLTLVEKNVTPKLIEELRKYWHVSGVKVREYRDCIHHYVEIGGPVPYAKIERVGDLYITKSMVPENPESRSWRLFRFSLDALDLAWEWVSTATEMASSVTAALRNE